MSKAFIPLTASSVAGCCTQASLRTGTLADSKTAVGFRPLDRNGTPPQAGTPVPCEPKVTCEREGDRVTRIRVQCSCGNTLELGCSY